jgi:hypothetical protein
MTRLRVYGVGETMRAVIEGDLPPELASGNRIGGIYQISPHRASSGARTWTGCHPPAK